MTGRRTAGFLFLAIALLVTTPSAAWAHLGGTGSVDQVARIARKGDTLEIAFELDMAEFPGGDLRKRFDRNRDGIDPMDERRGLGAFTREVKRALQLTLNGNPIALKLTGKPILDLQGDRTAADIPLTIRMHFQARLPEGFSGGTFELENRLFSDHLGFVRAHLDPGEGFVARLDDRVRATIERYEKANAVLVNGRVPELPKGERRPQIRRLTWQVAAGAPDREPTKAPTGASVGSSAQKQDAQPEKRDQPSFSAEQSRAVWDLFKNFDEKTTWVVIGFMVLAFWWGMGHALMPGHAKSISAAFLIGNKGTIKDAVILGLSVTASHIGAVVALGITAEIAAATIRRDKVIWWMELISALMIIGLGLFVFIRHLMALAGGPEVKHDHVHLFGGHHHHHDHDHGHGHHGHDHSHDHGHDHDHVHDHAHDHDHDHSHEHHGHDHSHDHSHDPGHDHDHVHPHDHAHDHEHHHGEQAHPEHRSEPESGERPGLWQIIYLGISGGMLPCPTALVIVSLAIHYHMFGLGLMLVTIFSVGMAGVLVAIGILTVKGFKVAEHYGSRRALMLFRVLPVLSGGFITLIGLAFLGTTMGWMSVPFLTGS